MHLSAVTSGLAAGTYQFGLCGIAINSANWNNNDWGYTSAIVLGGGGGGSSSVATTDQKSVDQSPADR